MKLSTRFLIIGAGPTGLGAAHRLKECGETGFLIADADTVVGGLAKSIRDENGYTWDVGGHVLFSHYEYFDALMNKLLEPSEWLTHERESWVWVRERFVPYPFQNNLRFLPKEEIWKCVSGAMDAWRDGSRPAPSNFREWILATFGEGIAEIFMLPYNFKTWATDPKDMGFGWIGQRVSVPDVKRILGNVILGREDHSWGPNNTFRFPRHGGTGVIWERLADRIGREKIQLGSRLIRVDARDHRAFFENGMEVSYERLLSTMPLDLFAGLVNGLPDEVKNEAAGLVHSSTNIVGVGMEGAPPAHLSGKCWMYFPEDNCPFYRATVFSHYSPNNVPDPKGQWSLMLEISESSQKKVNRETLAEDTRKGLVATKLIRPDEKINSLISFRVPYGYPVPSLRREEILNKVQPALEARDLSGRGRFGGWRYEVSNQDHSLMQGVEWADRVLFGTPEQTYFGLRGLAGKEPLPALPKAA